MDTNRTKLYLEPKDGHSTAFDPTDENGLSLTNGAKVIPASCILSSNGVTGGSFTIIESNYKTDGEITIGEPIVIR